MQYMFRHDSTCLCQAPLTIWRKLCTANRGNCKQQHPSYLLFSVFRFTGGRSQSDSQGAQIEDVFFAVFLGKEVKQYNSRIRR